MAKNIALFIDGTWDAADKKGETNVYKLFKSACACSEQSSENNDIPLTSDDTTQVVYYLKGVGTGGLIDKWFAGGTGFGTKKKIKKAYLFLALNYKDGDNVYLFGFSRGAYAARSLAGFVGVVGPTLVEVTEKKIAEAYTLYVNAEGEGTYRSALRADLQMSVEVIEGMRPIPVHFIGVWDTVKMLGVQMGSTDFTKYWTKHHDHPKLSEHINYARHALALHELRPEFEPTLWEDWWEHQSLQQVWFRGAHADVGGGYAQTELSDIALRWMACESKKYGLKLNDEMLPTVLAAYSGVVHYQKKIFLPHGPRKILSDWNSKSQKMMKSFLMHETASKQLFNVPPRKYWVEKPVKSKSELPVSELISGKNDGYGALLNEVDKLTLPLHLALIFRTQGEIPQGLEKVRLEDVAGCTAKVKEFFENKKIETADVGPLSTALPLFILSGGDCSSYVEKINNETNMISTPHALQFSELSPMEQWMEKLESIRKCLCKIPDSCSEDVIQMRESVENGIQNCKYKLSKVPLKHFATTEPIVPAPPIRFKPRER
jgi:hypothetical protein